MYRNILLDIPIHSLRFPQTPGRTLSRPVEHAWRRGFLAPVGRSFPHIRAGSWESAQQYPKAEMPLLRKLRPGYQGSKDYVHGLQRADDRSLKVCFQDRENIKITGLGVDNSQPCLTI